MEDDHKLTKSGYETPPHGQTDNDHNTARVTKSTGADSNTSPSYYEHEAPNDMLKIQRQSHSNVSKSDVVLSTKSTKPTAANTTKKRASKRIAAAAKKKKQKDGSAEFVAGESVYVQHKETLDIFSKSTGVVVEEPTESNKLYTIKITNIDDDETIQVPSGCISHRNDVPTKGMPSDMQNVDDEDDEEEDIHDEAKQLLECGDHEIYFMIEPRSLSIAEGVTMELDSLQPKEKAEMVRLDIELDIRYEVDATFVKQLMADSAFTEAIKLLRTLPPESSKVELTFLKSYVHSLNSMFENRYRYLYSLSSWTTIRSKYLEMEYMKKGLGKFFEKEVERFRNSIPEIDEFKQWLGCIETVCSLHKEAKKKTED